VAARDGIAMGRRVAFMGSPDFAVAALRALIASDVEVVGVVTQPDRPAGRGRSLRPPPVKVAALAHDLEVHQPRKIRRGRLAVWLQEREVDLAVVAAYGRLLPDDVLAAPTYGCVNLHASLLPRWRGASPIHRAIAAGDSETGVSLMRVVKELDAGPVMATIEVPISDVDTSATLHDKLAEAGAVLLRRHLNELLAGQLAEVPQDHEVATFAPPLDKMEGAVDWRLPARRIHAHIRAMTPWPGAWTRWQDSDERWKIFADDAQVMPGAGEAGTLLRLEGAGAVIACGHDALKVAILQRPGKRRMGAADALRGARREPGQRLECIAARSAEAAAGDGS